jgi:hypothetical protein
MSPYFKLKQCKWGTYYEFNRWIKFCDQGIKCCWEGYRVSPLAMWPIQGFIISQ